ncbi:multisubunit sodium/proton antiporter, MrpE subunit [Kytococcus aerolatus]|uniref:Multisubunit sodium/proton antiporter, MrpE subunit n=1 Tax=Kytococcus aerolatus TaxID=592308 RepID=A0A212T4T5_9MICO|nr:Na+/H+ antiporter subunit E [Kytococcus aerolatus]SNC61029.1 multisubunit sodium/proton antiporter, MrpE subunit [Kytococcus aerolatus]
MPGRLQALPLLWLVLLWMVFWQSWSPMVVFGGLVFAVAVSRLSPLPRMQVNATLRPWPFVVLVAVFLRDLVLAVLQVAAMVLLPGRRTDAAIVEVVFQAEEELFQTIASELITLVPGTMVIDVDVERRLATVHALGVRTPEDAEAIRRDCLAQEERVLAAFDADHDPRKGN